MKNRYNCKYNYLKGFTTGLFVILTFLILATSASADSAILCWTNGNCYQIIDGSTFNWDDAKIAAVSQTYNSVSGHLATITSPGETNFIVSSFGTGLNGKWLGGSQPVVDTNGDGPWVWVTGEPWSYTNWLAPPLFVGDEPNNLELWVDNPDYPATSNDPYIPTGIHENNLQFHGVPGTWNDAISSSTAGYLVEFDNAAPAGIPEFPTVALPIISVIALMFLVQRRKHN